MNDRPPFVPPPKQGPTKGMWTTPVKALEPAPGLPTELPEEVTGAPKPRSVAASPRATPRRRRPSSASRPRRRRRARSYSSDDSGSDDAASEEDEEEEDGGAGAEPEPDPAEVPLFSRQRFALAPPDVPPQQAPRKRTGGARKAVRHVTHAEDRPPPAPKPAQPPRCVSRGAAAAMAHRSRAARGVAPPPLRRTGGRKGGPNPCSLHRSRFRGFFRSSCAALDKDKHEMYFLRHANGGASLAAVVRPDAPRQPGLSPHCSHRPERRALTSTAPATFATPPSRAWPPRRCTTARAAVRCAARHRSAKPASR